MTGDAVAWQRTASGQQSAWLVDPAAEQAGPPLVYEQDGEVHLVPRSAQAYVEAGAVDANLFNITLLVQEGFDDRAQVTGRCWCRTPGRLPVVTCPRCRRGRASSAPCPAWARWR